jgi:hypothetical protein
MTDMLSNMVAGWKSHFWSADQAIEWRDVERQCTAWLSDNTLLVGVIDALGYNEEGKLFFGEWKTSSSYDRNTWKQTWRMNPQSLSYGVLVQSDSSIMPDCSNFTVRKAFKPAGRSHGLLFDHAWYSYGVAELRHWRGELLRIADEIRAYRAQGRTPWPTNFQRCFQYGVNYVCPFFEGCGTGNWSYVPPNSGIKEERDFVRAAIDAVPFKRAQKDLVVLSPSRVGQWLGCRELYRRQIEDKLVLPSIEALTLGKDFHTALAEHYRDLMRLRASHIQPGAQKFYVGIEGENENG